MNLEQVGWGTWLQVGDNNVWFLDPKASMGAFYFMRQLFRMESKNAIVFQWTILILGLNEA